jgi:hypothetical protein
MSRFTRGGRSSAVVVAGLLSAGVLAGCRHPHPPTTTTTWTPTSTSTSTTRPPAARPVAVVQGRTTTLRLGGFGCWSDRICVDPPPPGGLDNSPDIGATDEVTITVALEGLHFGAIFVPVGGGFGSPGVPGTMTQTGPTTWRLQPPATPGSYLVMISGGGVQGDLTYVFRWTVS